MAVTLSKGGKVSLAKAAQEAGLSSLQEVVIGLGWDVAKKRGFFGGGKSIDCDASAFVLTNGRIAAKDDIVYFNHLTHRSGAVRHMGDNLTGDGDGDDEQIIINLKSLPKKYDGVAVVVNIYRAEAKKQDFGMIQNAFIRICDNKTGKELVRYNLSDDYAGKTAMVFGRLYLHNGEWKFDAIGQGTNDGSVTELAKRYA